MRNAVIVLLAAAATSTACRPALAGGGDVSAVKARRAEALKRAHIWQPPARAVSQVDLTANPPGPDFLAPDRDVLCRFNVTVVGGATPKFECTLPDGREAKVRYGDDNPEIAAEIAATRLMSALGFPTDSLYAVRSVNCQGCPRYPFLALRCYRNIQVESACMLFRSEDVVRSFAPVVVELRHPGKKIESFENEGWAFYELEAIDPRLGAPRAHVDALRLMAVFLAHWDNKSENQRLICASGDEERVEGCSRPMAMIQDLGGSFGPFKTDLAQWTRRRIWTKPRRCAVSLEDMPFRGGTFAPRDISEGGRRLIADLLSQLSRRQVRDLFAAAGFRQVDQWVRAFESRVEQIRTAGPCPQ